LCRFFSYFHSFSHFISFLFFLEAAVKNQKENPPAFTPQTPFCGREISRGKAKNQNPQKKDFRFAESILKPYHLPDSLRAESRKKCSHPFRRNWSRANQKSGEHFFAGHASGASGGGVDSFVQRF